MKKIIGMVAVLCLGASTALAEVVKAEPAPTQQAKAKQKVAPTLWASSYKLERNGEYEKAAAILLPKLKAGNDQEYAQLRYAWLSYMQGNFNDAIRNYKQAIKKNARSIDARLGIALPLMAQKRWKEASRYLKQVLGMSPYHYTAHLRLMVCEEGLRQWKGLTKHALSLAASYPSDTSILVYLARSYAWQDKQALAKQAYQRVLVRFPYHYEAVQYIKYKS